MTVRKRTSAKAAQMEPSVNAGNRMPSLWYPLVLAVALLSVERVAFAAEVSAEDEAVVFTPPGFEKVGEVREAMGSRAGRIRVLVRDRATGEETFCRINVVGADGNFYHPVQNYLTPYALTGDWPKEGRGNRRGKAPIRYFGRFFYSWGDATVAVPPGPVRVEVWKGFEFRPQSLQVNVKPGGSETVEVTLARTRPMSDLGYYSGDPHLHLSRESDRDDQLILDLMQAADIRYGSILAYNEPAGPYAGVMQSMDTPQFRGLGARSLRSRDGYQIMSGQEYRSTTYGHLNLFNRDELVLPDRELNANDWPLYGALGRETQSQGGFAFYAHGGYAQSIYADFVQGDINGVELLQFAIYRGIGLADWYNILNIGYRFPATGASDYPACRKLGDCRTYIHHPHAPSFEEWLHGAAEGNSFITTGPLLLLEVDGNKPGAIIHKTGQGSHEVKVSIRVACEVAPVTHLQLVVNGEVTAEKIVSAAQENGNWLEWDQQHALTDSSWIAARAFSTASSGAADAEAHTNPVYVYSDGKAPYQRASLDRLVERIDEQITDHKQRDFDEKAAVIAYFERSRDILLAIRAADGVSAEGHPSQVAAESLTVLEKPGARLHSAEELKEFLKPVPPRTPEEALESFESVNGFHMELVAAEPLVYDPVAAAFDENGRLYVAEMRDYPFRPREGHRPLGTIRLLRDTDADGRFDQSNVFADNLLWAAGVAPWKGGVFVAAPPDIWYLKDTDGDFKADLREKVFTGFGTENQQAMLNNLKWGLDHKIYGATAGNGGSVRTVKRPAEQAVSVDGGDFRFDPVSGRFEAITGTIQFGNTFDDWGNRFVCSESRPLLQAVLPRHYMARNPYLAVPNAIHNIAGGSVPIHRISPVERWRHIRSSRRISHKWNDATRAGVSHHVIDAAAGVTVYRGGAYPEEYYGNLFVGGAQNNLIHRMLLVPDGVTFRSKRADSDTEFVRSSDNWFRPVNFVNAPDGTLYALDLSREILESIHIPLDVMPFIDLENGRNSGRIYRIAPPGFKSPPPPRLEGATPEELAAALESPHGWWRETAHRLIYERQDVFLIGPLRELLAASSLPQARLHALWSLEGLSALDEDDICTALADPSPSIREHALRLGERRLDTSARILRHVLKMVDDDHPQIRFQVAFSLGETTDPRATTALARIAKRDADDKWIRAAVLSSAGETAGKLFVALLEKPALVDRPEAIGLMSQLAETVGGRNQPDELDSVLDALATHPAVSSKRGLQRRLVLSLGRGLRRAGGHLQVTQTGSSHGRNLLATLVTEAKKRAGNSQRQERDREQAVMLLGQMEYTESRDVLLSLIDPRVPESVQIAALKALAGYAEAETSRILLDRWRQYTPNIRKQVVRTLLAREQWTLVFLKSAANGMVNAAQIGLSQQTFLSKHRSPTIRGLAAELFGGATAGPRQEIVAAYQAALATAGDQARGAKVFERECIACHRLGRQGHAIGPDLSASSARDPLAMLAHILDPNRYVLPNYQQYAIVDRDGRVYSGLIAAQTATGITLRREKGASDTILRMNIEGLINLGKSLMPEGFEKNISKPEMADLIAFLSASHTGTTTQGASLDIGTLPGLLEPDD
jgi:putative membrane-bound dehydrogenase-like protein